MTFPRERFRFIGVGAQKAGTTTLHDVLKRHPDIYLPTPKEAHFFDRPDRLSKGLDWWFQRFFSTYRSESVIGVFTPEYLFYDEVPERLLDAFGPSLKILICLRDPVARAYSHYNMSLSRGYEKLPFSDAIAVESTRVAKGEFERNHFSYISRGLYHDQVRRYLDAFGRPNVRILQFERDIQIDIASTIQSLLCYLGVRPITLTPRVVRNAASRPRSRWLNHFLRSDSWAKRALGRLVPDGPRRRVFIEWIARLNSKAVRYRPLSAEERRLIYERYFADDIAALEALIGREFTEWKPTEVS